VYSNEVKEFDFQNKDWEDIKTFGDVPPGLKKHSAVILKGLPNMLIFGGSDANGKLSNMVYNYNIEKRNWAIMKTSGSIPEGRIDFTAEVTEDGKKMIVLGGMGKAWYNDLYSLSLINGEWTKIISKNPPVARTCHSGIIYNNKLVIFGGLKSWFADGYLNDLHEFNFNTLTWREIKPNENDFIPMERSKHSAIVTSDGKSMLMFGGRSVNQFLYDIWRLDLDTYQWNRLLPNGGIPKARNSHATILFENLMYVFGGFNDRIVEDSWKGGYMNQVAIYDPWKQENSTKFL